MFEPNQKIQVQWHLYGIYMLRPAFNGAQTLRVEQRLQNRIALRILGVYLRRREGISRDQG